MQHQGIEEQDVLICPSTVICRVQQHQVCGHVDVLTCVVDENVYFWLGVYKVLCGASDGLEGGEIQVVYDHRVASLFMYLLGSYPGFLQVSTQHHHARPFTPGKADKQH